MKRIWLKLLEILFPRFCVGCSKEGRYLCDDCLLFVSEASLFCPSCGKNSRLGERCFGCQGELDGVIVLWDNDSIIKRAIEMIKERGVYHITDELLELFLLMIENQEERFTSFLEFILDEETTIFSDSYLAKKIAFLFKKEIKESKKTLLIDFIWSDGSSMKEEAKALKDRGVEEVWGLVLARERV